MKRAAILVLVSLLAACGETDVDGGRQAVADTTIEVEPVDLDTVDWFTEGRPVEFDNRTWLVAGEPVIDPVVERVGEFEGTPLYADVNTSPPYNELFVPLENDYWQLLEEGPTGVTDTVSPDTVAPDTVATDPMAEDTVPDDRTPDR